MSAEDPADIPLAIYLVKQLELAIKTRLDQVLGSVGVTTAQLTALTSLRERGGLTSAQLARRAFVTPQAMHEMITGLGERGLIVKRRDPDNGRVLLLHLTTKGRDLLRRCDPVLARVERELLDAVDDRLRNGLRANLSDAIAALRLHSERS